MPKLVETPLNENAYPLSCETAEPLFEEYLDGTLNAFQERAMNAHLESCPACADEMALGRRILDELHELPALEPRPAVTRAVLEHAEKNPPLWQRLRAFFKPQQAWQPALAMLFLAVLGFGYLRVAGPTSTSPTALPPEASYSEAEIAQAEAELKLALAYLGRINRKASDTVSSVVPQEHFVGPIGASITQAVLPQLGIEIKGVEVQGNDEI